jgi:hypothetical protein
LNPIKGSLNSVDLSRLDEALGACRFLLEHLDADGSYVVSERWGPESNLYLAEIAWPLLEAYRITRLPEMLRGAERVLDCLERLQKPCGGWTLDLGPDGLEFTASEQERRPTWEREDPPVVGAVAYAVAKFTDLTGRDRYREMLERGLSYLLPMWNPEGGYFSEDHEEHLSSLRSNPAAYQAMNLLGLGEWLRWQPTLKSVVEGLVRSSRSAFESFDDETMPFMRAYHALLMLKHSDSEYAAREVRPRIQMLLDSPIYRSPGIEGGYGHRDGSRGIVTTEANMRGTGAVAIAARFYDLTTGSDTFCKTKAYREAAEWIDGMKRSEGGYFEYQAEPDLRRRGLGSPGQYIPCWWIFGAL